MTELSQNALRRISVHVEEPEPGSFKWVLSEASPNGADDWHALKRARKVERTFHAAMAEGLAALEALTDDLDIGPRAPLHPDSGSEDPRPGKRATPTTRARQEADAKRAKPTAFGFGVLK